MDKLIEALTILRKYGNPNYPTICSHDLLTVCIDEALVSEEDMKKLDELGFFVGDQGGFNSHRFGSA